MLKSLNPKTSLPWATVPWVQLVDINDMAQGPAHVARQLCTTAELNEDQMQAVALVAKPLQEAWDKSRVAREHATTISPSADNGKLPLAGALVRLLIVGGGGCGKTHIFNKVLIPLLTAFTTVRRRYGGRTSQAGVLTNVKS